VDSEIRWAVTEVLSRYGHVVDNQAWAELGSVFTSDAVIDAQYETAQGLAEIRRYLESFDAKRSHHSLTPIIQPGEPSEHPRVVHAWSRFIVVEYDATVLCGDYVDVVVEAAEGWRIQRRRISPRNRADTAPGGQPWRTESFGTWGRSDDG
jgi:hypothetical protein